MEIVFGFIIYLIISCLLSNKIGQISEKKGLTYSFGFIVSFFISPIIGYLIVSLRKEKLLLSESKKCPYCYNRIHIRSIKCLYCHEILVKDDDIDSFQKKIDEEFKNRKENKYNDDLIKYKKQKQIISIIVIVLIILFIIFFL